MTALHLADVAAAIAALVVNAQDSAGKVRRLTIKDLHEMPASVDERECPLLGPAVDRAFLTDWESQRISAQGNTRHVYTLNYTLYQAKTGQGRGLFEQYPAMVATAQYLADTLHALTKVNGCQRLELAAMPAFGRVLDASEQAFHGATISLRVTQF
jgi:hypothetical protein